MKVVVWSHDQAKKEMQKRLNYAMQQRKSFEEQWALNEITLYGKNGIPIASGNINVTELSLGNEDEKSPIPVEVNFVQKNFRYIHAQMSANPPSATAKPATSDQEDRRRGQAADKLCQHFMRKLNLTERVDQTTLQTLLYGVGCIKTYWNPYKGDILEYDQETAEITLEGEHDVTNPSMWDIFVNPDAKSEESLDWLFERRFIPWDEAKFIWPEHEEKLNSCRIQNQTGNVDGFEDESEIKQTRYDSVEIFEYWERGEPHNGYLGRHCITLRDGTLLTEVKPNPFRFKSPGKATEINKLDIAPEQKEYKLSRIPEKARLPYIFLTDIDVANQFYGKSALEYCNSTQNLINILDGLKLDNIEAHGAIRILASEATEFEDESIRNSPYQIVKFSGAQPPFPMSTPQMLPDLTTMRDTLKLGIDDAFGVNESMFGQQSRETSGASMQYATNQGNMIRRRIFNKYRGFVETMYKNLLDLARKHWEIPRTVSVLGKENVIQAVDLKGADIDGGFDIHVDYGTSLSLDPQTRREEIINYIPILEKAGLPVKQIVKHMKLNELDNIYESLEYASNRQQEIFEEMMITRKYIAPRELQDHENMLIYARQWVMTAEYKVLEEEDKILIEQHMKERQALMAAEISGMNAAMAQGGLMSPGPMGMPSPVPGVQPPPGEGGEGTIPPILPG